MAQDKSDRIIIVLKTISNRHIKNHFIFIHSQAIILLNEKLVINKKKLEVLFKNLILIFFLYKIVI